MPTTQNQVPSIGIPFPSFTQITDTAQRTTVGSLINAAGEVDATINLTGLSSTASIGTLTPSLSSSLTGLAGTAALGTLTPEVDLAVTGLSATAAIGTETPEVDIAITGQEATAAIGTPDVVSGQIIDLTGLEATSALGTVTPEIDVPLTGLSATAAVPATLVVTTPILIPITGLAANAIADDVTPEIDIAITGQGATAAIGTLAAVNVSPLMLVGQAVTASLGPLFVTYGPNRTWIYPTGQQATAAIGTLTPNPGPLITGQEATATIGDVHTQTYAQHGFYMGDLLAAEPLNSSDIYVGLRWSDTYGESWDQCIHQSMGATGAFLTNLQFRRLGMARNRVYEVSWSAPSPTALQGITLQYEIAAT